MPYDLAWEPHGVYKRFFGHLTVGDLLQSSQDVNDDPRFDSLRFAINDFLGIEGHAVTAAAVRQQAAANLGSMRSNPNVRVVVVTTDPSVRALTDLYASPKLRPYPVEIFATLAEARAWLERSPWLAGARHAAP